jgi:hypothetical protein
MLKTFIFQGWKEDLIYVVLSVGRLRDTRPRKKIIVVDTSCASHEAKCKLSLERRLFKSGKNFLTATNCGAKWRSG